MTRMCHGIVLILTIIQLADIGVHADDKQKSTANTAPVARALHGRVTYGDTGEGCPRARVWLWRKDDESKDDGITRLETDEHGKFRLSKAHPAGYDMVIVFPPTGAKYLGFRREKISLNEAVTEVNIRLLRGLTMTGTVIDSITRQAVPNVTIAADWERQPDDSDDAWFLEAVQTNALGQFAIAVPPGKGQVRVGGAPERYKVPGHERCGWYSPQSERTPPRYVRRYSASLKDTLQPLSFEIDRGVRVRGHVTTLDGKPIAKAQVFDAEDKRGASAIAVTDVSGNFDLRVIDGPSMHLYVAHPEQKLNFESWIPLPGSRSEREAQTNVVLQPPAAIKFSVLIQGQPANQRSLHWSCEVQIDGRKQEYQPFHYVSGPNDIGESTACDFVRDEKTGQPIGNETILPGLAAFPKGTRLVLDVSDTHGHSKAIEVRDLKPGEVRDLGAIEVMPNAKK